MSEYEENHDETILACTSCIKGIHIQGEPFTETKRRNGNLFKHYRTLQEMGLVLKTGDIRSIRYFGIIAEEMGGRYTNLIDLYPRVIERATEELKMGFEEADELYGKIMKAAEETAMLSRTPKGEVVRSGMILDEII